MDYREQLLTTARKAIVELPRCRSEIVDLYRLAVGEIEAGESAAHEYELFVGSVDEMRKEKRHGH